jgi:ketosteroid isomerase-like protein
MTAIAATGIAAPLRPPVDALQRFASRALVEQLFLALREGETDALLSRYAEHVRIEHPLLGVLDRDEFAAALRSFARRSPGHSLTYAIEDAEGDRVEASWRLNHLFHETGRLVAISGASVFVLAAGRIVRQTDRFDRRDWARQALGLTGLVLSFLPGWRAFLRRELRRSLEIDTDEHR